MWRNYYLKSALLTLIFFVTSVFSLNHDEFRHLFPKKTVYFGVNVGGGSTEWKYLVDTVDPTSDDNNADQNLPSSVSEGGASWGVVFGYDVARNFALELQYMQFANSTIYFSAAYSNYYLLYGIASVVSKTDAYSLSGKFFVPVGNTRLRAFAAIGAGLVQRHDSLIDFNPNDPNAVYTGRVKTASCVTPYVSAGLDYHFTRHWIIEGGFQYYTGFGASELYPVRSFIPFAWDAYGRLAYQL